MSLSNRIYLFLKKLKVLPPKYYFIGSANFYNSEKKNSILPKRIFYNRKTPLCKIMEKHGSDKGCFNGIGMHNYTTIYFELFKKKRNQNIRLFELGIGTTNSSIIANMGVKGMPGASLRGWRDFFSKGEIYAADIDKKILFNEQRIKTYFCDQTNKDIIKQMWSEIDSAIMFDYILDDGLHQFDANLNFFENSIYRLKENGIYIVEDIHINEIDKWDKYICKNIENYKYLFIRLPNSQNNWDNNLLIVQRHDEKN